MTDEPKYVIDITETDDAFNKLCPTLYKKPYDAYSKHYRQQSEHKPKKVLKSSILK